MFLALCFHGLKPLHDKDVLCNLTDQRLQLWPLVLRQPVPAQRFFLRACGTPSLLKGMAAGGMNVLDFVPTDYRPKHLVPLLGLLGHLTHFVGVFHQH